MRLPQACLPSGSAEGNPSSRTCCLVLPRKPSRGKRTRHAPAPRPVAAAICLKLAVKPERIMGRRGPTDGRDLSPRSRSAPAPPAGRMEGSLAQAAPSSEPEPEPEPGAAALQTNGDLFDDCFGSSDEDGAGGASAEHGSGVGWVRPPAGLPVWEEVLSSEVDGGQGLRATVAIAKNGEIHREAAALRCPNAHAASSLEEALRLHKQCVLSRFTELPAKQQGEIMVLFSWDKYNDHLGARTAWGIFQTNSVRLSGQDEGDGGLFRTMCRMNHSCSPNVVCVHEEPQLPALHLGLFPRAYAH